MSTGKQHKPGAESNPETTSEEHDFWVRQYLKHFEIELLETVTQLQESPTLESYHLATLSAVIRTLVDSGMPAESFGTLAAKALSALGDSPAVWRPEMNARRMELIDRQIQETITVGEQIELAQLTEAMRAVVDTEENMPMAGAKALHLKLLSIHRDEAGD